MSWKEDLKEACREFGIDDGYRVEIEDFISNLLKKQRENCAKTMVDWENHSIEECENCSVIWNEILNAPEPK